MNILDQFRYSRDDPSQLNIKLKQDPYEKVGTSKNQNINNLLSNKLEEICFKNRHPQSVAPCRLSTRHI